MQEFGFEEDTLKMILDYCVESAEEAVKKSPEEKHTANLVFETRRLYRLITPTRKLSRKIKYWERQYEKIMMSSASEVILKELFNNSMRSLLDEAELMINIGAAEETVRDLLYDADRIDRCFKHDEALSKRLDHLICNRYVKEYASKN